MSEKCSWEQRSWPKNLFAVEVLTNPLRSSWTRMSPQSCPKLKHRSWTFYSHIIQSLATSHPVAGVVQWSRQFPVAEGNFQWETQCERTAANMSTAEGWKCLSWRENLREDPTIRQDQGSTHSLIFRLPLINSQVIFKIRHPPLTEWTLVLFPNTSHIFIQWLITLIELPSDSNIVQGTP